MFDFILEMSRAGTKCKHFLCAVNLDYIFLENIIPGGLLNLHGKSESYGNQSKCRVIVVQFCSHCNVQSTFTL